MNIVDEWTPDCWVAALTQICEANTVSGPEGDIRYPEQWMYVTWKPMHSSMPRTAPDGWGLTVGDPWHTLLEIFGTDPVCELDSEDCLWSAWLSIPLACDRFAPWLTSAITAAQQKARVQELVNFAERYGNYAEDTQKILQKITREVPAADSPGESVTGLLARLAKPRDGSH